MIITTDKKNKGIILITIMILLTVIIMIVTLISMSAVANLKGGQKYSESEQAQYAALSGLEYVRAQVYQNPEWTPISKEPVTIYDESCGPLKVIEKEGAVEVLFGSEEGSQARSRFRIALIPPSPSGSINEQLIAEMNSKEEFKDINFLSCNNLSSTSEGTTFKRDPQTKEFKIYKSNIPKNTIHIISQGICNKTVRYAEALISVEDIKEFKTSSVARGNIDINLIGANPSALISAKSQESTSLRAYGYLDIHSTAKNKNCFVNFNNGYTSAQNIKICDFDSDGKQLKENIEKYGVNIDTTDNALQHTDKMLEAGNKINWDNTAGSRRANIDSGAYIYNTKEGQWYHCAAIQSDGETIALQANPTAIGNQLKTDNMSFNGKEVRFSNANRCSGSIFFGAVDNINPYTNSGKAKTLSISKEERPNIIFGEGSSLEADSGTDRLSPDIILQAKVSGSGKILSKGNICMQGGSFFDTRKNSGVSVYAQKNVHIIETSAKEYEAAFKEVSDHIDDIWREFIGSEEEQERFTTEKEAAAELLDHKGAKGTLKDILAKNGCTDSKEQLLFAQTVIAKNSGVVGGDIDTSTPSDSGSGFEDVNVTLEKKGTSTTQNTYTIGILRSDDKYLYDKYINRYYETVTDIFHSSPHTTNVSIEKVDSTATTAIMGTFPDISGQYTEIWLHNMKGSDNTHPFDILIHIPEESNKSAYAKLRNHGASKPVRYTFKIEAEEQYFKSGSEIQVNIPRIMEKIKDEFKKEYEDAVDSSYDMGTIEAIEGGLTQLAAVTNNMKKMEYTGKSWDKNGESSGKNMIINLEDETVGYRTDTDPDTIRGDFGPDQHLKLKNKLKKDYLPEKNDTILRGMVFVREGDFKANVNKGSLTVIGGIVAYGKDDQGNLTDKGNISINNAELFQLCYDPDYMQFFYGKSVITKYMFRGIFSKIPHTSSEH